MADVTPRVHRLIAEIAALPGIGGKTARRIAYHLTAEPEKIKPLTDALLGVREHVRFCAICANFTEGDVCSICADPKREGALVCVVEEAKDITAIESVGCFSGRYHVLGGVIAPLENRNPEDLNTRSLIKRITEENIKELILAFNQSAEADITALYLAKLLSPLGVKLSRPAQGLPMGAVLEHIDKYSLMKSLEQRTEI